MAVGVAQQRGGVGGVQDQARVALAQRPRPGREARELLAEEVVAALVGGGEVRHRAHELARGALAAAASRHARRLLGVARAQAPHPGVELDVHAPAAARGHRVDERLAPGDDVGARALSAASSSSGLSAPRTSSGPSTPAARSCCRLVGGRHREPRGAAGQRGAGGGAAPRGRSRRP